MMAAMQKIWHSVRMKFTLQIERMLMWQNRHRKWCLQPIRFWMKVWYRRRTLLICRLIRWIWSSSLQRMWRWQWQRMPHRWRCSWTRRISAKYIFRFLPNREVSVHRSRRATKRLRLHLKYRSQSFGRHSSSRESRWILLKWPLRHTNLSEILNRDRAASLKKDKDNRNSSHREEILIYPRWMSCLHWWQKRKP